MTGLFERLEVRTWVLDYEGEIPVIAPNVAIERWNSPKPENYLELYRTVGEQWGWTGRLLLTKEELEAKLNLEYNEVWLFKINHELKGFFEIDKLVEGKAEIVYLGLLPGEIGKGFGKVFLDAAIATAGQNGDKVWLHTCEFDHHNALSIYLKAGFKIKQETIELEYYPANWSDRNSY